MRIDILTLFPEMFAGPLTESILKRATDAGFLHIQIHNIRDYAQGRHSQVDDKPYGGGAGMLMMCEPVVQAIEKVIALGVAHNDTEKGIRGSQGIRRNRGPRPHRIYLSPRGKTLKQIKVERLAKQYDWLLLLCGHYEGIDQRIIDGGWIDEEISIGDYVLTGGELPAMVLVDAIARHIPGVLGKNESAQEESFSKSLKRKREYPHYTRPEEFRGLKVPDELMSGHHKNIEQWRRSKLG